MVKTKTIVDQFDGLPVMEVGGWSKDKHLLIKKFVDASWGARSKFGQRTYVDLFSGPGKVIVRGQTEVGLGSPLVAWAEAGRTGGAFTEVLVADVDPESVAACAARLQKLSAPVTSFCAEASRSVDLILPRLKQSGLHLALLDPYNIGHLHFPIIEKLSRLRHVDVIVHFSVMDLQRNIDQEYASGGNQLEAFAPGWRQHVPVQLKNKDGARAAFWDYWVGQVKNTGFNVAGEKIPIFRNSKRAGLYALVLLYKNPLALKLWNSVAQADQSQREMLF